MGGVGKRSRGFRIRPMRRADATAARRLCARIFPRERGRFRFGEWLKPARDGAWRSLGFVAVRGSRVAGVALCAIVRRNSVNAPGRPTGRLDVIAVDSLSRRRGIATALWKHMERKLKRLRVRSVWTMSRPLTYGVELMKYPEAVVLLLKLGFTKEREIYDQEADLPRLDLATGLDEARLRRDGIEVRPAEYRDRSPLKRWLRRLFPQWLDVPGSIKREGRQNVYVACKGRKLIAFSASYGRGFGPIGVDPKYRWKGLGKVLLLRCLADVRARGHRKAFIGWANFPFYARAISAPITRIMWQMERRL